MTSMLESLFDGMFGGTIVMVLVSAAVIFFLRALYGPRGRFRDPKWDESNRRIRQQEAEARERRLKAFQDEQEKAIRQESEDAGQEGRNER